MVGGVHLRDGDDIRRTINCGEANGGTVMRPTRAVTRTRPGSVNQPVGSVADETVRRMAWAMI